MVFILLIPCTACKNTRANKIETEALTWMQNVQKINVNDVKEIDIKYYMNNKIYKITDKETIFNWCLILKKMNLKRTGVDDILGKQYQITIVSTNGLFNAGTILDNDVLILKKHIYLLGIKSDELSRLEQSLLDHNTFDEAKAISMVIKDHPDFPSNPSITIRKNITLGGPLGPDGSPLSANVIFTTKVKKYEKSAFVVTLTKDWGFTVNGTYVKSYWKYKVTPTNVTLLKSIDNDVLASWD